MKMENSLPVRVVVALAFGLAAAFSAPGATNAWISPVSGKWEAATNWSLGLAPTNTQSLFITNAGADTIVGTNANLPLKRVTIDATTSGSFGYTMTVSNLTLVGFGSNVVNSVKLDGAGTNLPLHVLNQVSLADGGLLVVTNSTLQIDGLLSIGLPGPPAFVRSNFNSTFTLLSGSAQVANIVVGPTSNSFGVLGLPGGTLWVTNSLQLATAAGGSTGLVVVAGGTLLQTNSTLVVGGSGTGEIVQSGGAVLAQSVQLGQATNSQGLLFLYGGAFTVLQRLIVGTNFSGGSGSVLILTNGALYVTNTAHTAYMDIVTNGSVFLQGGLLQLDNFILTNGGTFEDTAGTLIFTKPFQVENGTTVNVNGGTTIAGSDFTLGAVSNSTGTVIVQSGGALNVTNGVLGIGNNGTTTQGSGTGVATVDSATLNVATLNLGSSAGGLGSLTLQGSAAVSVRSNFTLVSSSLTTTSSVSLTSGSLVVTNSLVQVGPTGSGQVLISGGNHTLRQVRLGSTNGTGSGFLHLSGGLLTVLGAGTGPSSGLDANLIVIDGGDLNGSGTSLTIGDAHSAEVDVSGDGAAQFAAMYVGYTPGYSGTYSQSGGTMVISSNLIVGDFCPQGVSGALGSVTLSGGTLYVTNATHTAVLDVRNGTFALNAGSTLVFDKIVLTNSCGRFLTNGGVISPWYGATGAVFTSNLLLNPGAETGDLSFWTVSGSPSPVVADTSYNASFGLAPHRGGYDFAGGADFGSLVQIVSLAGNQGLTAAALDSGQLLAIASFWEQGAGAGPFYDDAAMTLTFLDADSLPLNSVYTPEIDSHDGSWSNYVAQLSLPSGTRFIQYEIDFNPYTFTPANDAFIDDNSLIIASPPALTLTRSGGTLVLSWPAWASSFLLQSTTNLAISNSWQPVGTVPTATSAGFFVTNALSGPARFYRLLSQ